MFTSTTDNECMALVVYNPVVAAAGRHAQNMVSTESCKSGEWSSLDEGKKML